MKRSHRIYLRIAVMLIIVVSTMASCIKEPTGECEIPDQKRAVTIFYSYLSKTKTLWGIDPDDVKKINLYAFDADGVLVEKFLDIPDRFDQSYSKTINLNPGTYTFVSWFNQQNPFVTVPYEMKSLNVTLQDAILSIVRPSDDTIRSAIPILMHAIYSNAQVMPTGEQSFTLSMVQNTKMINITVRGLTPNNADYSFVITDRNGKYNFNNALADDTDFHYLANSKFDQKNELFASISTLSLAPDRKVQLRIENSTTDTLVFKGDIVALIRAAISEGAQSIDWVNTNVFDLIIEFNDDMTVGFIINGWNLVDELIEV